MRIGLRLKNFVETVYGVDLENITDFDNFYFDWVGKNQIYGLDSYIKEFIKKHPEYSDVEEEDFVRAANMRYESSYIDDYWEEVKKELENKISKDIKNVSEFYIGDLDEVATKGSIELAEFDILNDMIIFEGKNVVDDFAAIVINCINGYGMFHYDDVEDFFDTQPATTVDEKVDAIEGHLHWLKHFENIYGTVYNAFKVDLSELDRYTNFGDYDFTVDDIDCAVN